MKKINVLYLINIGLIIIILIFGVLHYNTSNRQTMAYVNNIKLFNGFNMVKDIKTIEERKMKAKEEALDSLFTLFQSIPNKETDLAKSLQLKMASGSKELQEYQNNVANDLSQQVWTRLNSYIKEYSLKKDLKIVFGSNGSGNVMFADENFDITDDFIEFSNLRYEGN